MKQIILIGDLNHWDEEARFISDMMHMTATGVITMNIGRQNTAADLNARELRQLFPGKVLDECIHLAILKMFSQGLIDGIMALLGREPHLYSLVNRAFASIPFGQPKVAVLKGNSLWPPPKDVLPVFLPGTAYSMNPVIKIVLSNVSFALSGMSLCSVRNFGSSQPTVGAVGFQKEIGRFLAGEGINYITFAADDQLLLPLLRNGYLGGLIIDSEVESCRSSLEVAAAREIPIVIASRNPAATAAKLAFFPEVTGQINLVSAEGPYQQGIAPTAGQSPLRHFLVSHKYGSESFLQFAVKVLAGCLR